MIPMDRLIARLSERRLFTVILACTYLTLVILFHKEVSGISDWLSAKLSFKVYNDLIFLISVMVLVVFAVFVLIGIIEREQRFLKIIYWIFTTFLVVISYQTLLIFNVEIIHFPQYAILTLPVFALFKHFGETVFWVTLSGTFDEAFQYFVLHPETSFDFNDIVLNLIGAGIGVVLIYTLLAPKSESLTFHGNPSQKWNKYLVFVIAAWILFGGILLYASGILRFYPEVSAPKALIVLSGQPAPTQFWTILNLGKPYHQLHPIEGIFFSALLIACYSLMDYVLKTRKHKANDEGSRSSTSH
jgi:VanZ family protein